MRIIRRTSWVGGLLVLVGCSSVRDIQVHEPRPPRPDLLAPLPALSAGVSLAPDFAPFPGASSSPPGASDFAATPAAPTAPGMPAPMDPGGAAPAPAAPTPDASALAAASPAGGEGGGSYAPQMIGDFMGYVAKCVVPSGHTMSVVAAPVVAAPVAAPVQAPVESPVRQVQAATSTSATPGRALAVTGTNDGTRTRTAVRTALRQAADTAVPAAAEGRDNRIFTAAARQLAAAAPTGVVASPGTSTATVPVQATRVVHCPVPGRAAFKIADNESPRPRDRIFLNYNYFTGLNSSLNPGLGNTSLHRETLGFEKTFLGGAGSVGLRAPVFQQRGDGSLSTSDFGDLTMVLKYAFVDDPAAGWLYSAGLALTVPTGPGIDTVDGTIRSTLFQPYTGYLLQSGGVFVQGFTSLVVPTDSRDVTVLFSDVGIGYRVPTSLLYGVLNAVTPTVELHSNTPLNHRGSGASPIGMSDSLVVTSGVHFGLYRALDVTTALAVPLTGPKPYDVEAVLQVNWRF